MSWALFVYLLAVILQVSLMGRNMYALLLYADLEQDFINPYDLCKKVNHLVMIEYGAQLLSTVILILGGRWFIGLVQVGLCGYMAYLYVNKKIYMDATDAFKQLSNFKRRRTIILVVNALSSLFLMYMLIQTFVMTVMTPSGRETAKQLFKEAATSASLHGY